MDINVIFVGGPQSRGNLSRAFHAETRICLGAIPQSIEQARRLYNEYDVAHYSQVGLLESRSHGKN